MKLRFVLAALILTVSLLGTPLISHAQTVTATVAAGTGPAAVAVNPTTNKIYVTNQNSANLTVIDGASNSTTTVTAGTIPAAVAVNSVTNKIYVANEVSNNVTVIDGASNSPTTVTAGSNPAGVAVNPVTNKIYVANAGSNNVTVIDGTTNSTTTVAAGTFPFRVAVNSVTNKIYVANEFSNNVTVIDGATNSTTPVAVGTSPFAVAVNSVTNKIYVANSGSNNVTVIDGATNSTTPVAVGTAPRAVGINSVSDKIYVVNQTNNGVTVIDGATNSTTPVAVGTSPFDVAVNSVTNKIYVANGDGNTVSNVTVIDGATNSTTTVAAGTFPDAVAVNPVTNKIYVANFSSNNVTVIDGAGSSGCQINVTRLYQAVNASGVVQSWACDIYNHPYGTQSSRYCPVAPPQIRIAQVGCALTALTMSLNTAGLSFDPGTLNSFMLDPQHAYDFGPDHGVSFDTTVDDVASANKTNLNWTWFSSTSVQDLQNKVCTSQVPIIVGVDLTLNQANQPVPGHYVLATGWDGTEIQIADPGYPARTSLLTSYGNQFVGAGYVQDPQTTTSSLHISVNDAELLVTDPNGLKSGFDLATSENLNQIPGSAYSRSGLVNDETGQPAPEFGYYLDVHQPASGSYTLNIQALKLGTYNLAIRTFDVNGDPEPPISAAGIGSVGSNQIISIQVSTSAGGTSTVSVVATFESTLADIQNSLSIGLIDNARIAKVLSRLIEAAADAAAKGDRLGERAILDAFIILVDFETPKHISSVAAKVLLQDADSLFDENQ